MILERWDKLWTLRPRWRDVGTSPGASAGPNPPPDPSGRATPVGGDPHRRDTVPRGAGHRAGEGPSRHETVQAHPGGRRRGRPSVIGGRPADLGGWPARRCGGPHRSRARHVDRACRARPDRGGARGDRPGDVAEPLRRAGPHRSRRPGPPAARQQLDRLAGRPHLYLRAPDGGLVPRRRALRRRLRQVHARPGAGRRLDQPAEAVLPGHRQDRNARCRHAGAAAEGAGREPALLARLARVRHGGAEIGRGRQGHAGRHGPVPLQRPGPRGTG